MSPPVLPFDVESGPFDCGWSKFRVTLGEQSWQCMASYIDDHPIQALVRAAIEMHAHLFEGRPFPPEHATWQARACDEPGGIVLRLAPSETQIGVTVFNYPGEPLWPDPAAFPEIPPVATSNVDFWTFAEAVQRDAARLLAAHGITGFTRDWSSWDWASEIDKPPLFPVAHFLALTCLTRDRRPLEALSLAEEIDVLRALLPSE